MKDRLEKYHRNSLSLFIPAIIALLLLNSGASLTGKRGEESVRIMFYNVENLFDTLDSKLDDEEFLPGGLRRWNKYKYERKLDNISKVIIAAGGWSPPSIIGLCEVENSNVLSDLITRTVLERIGYSYLYSEGTDKRGIGVALLFRKDFSLISSESYCPVDSLGDSLKTRSILFAKLAYEKDTLGVVVTHWPSRRGGVSATNRYREIVAEYIREKILAAAGDMKIIIMGDLNCEPDSYIIHNMAGAAPGKDTALLLYNTALHSTSGELGTYKYQGLWYSFDQILLGLDLLDANNGFSYIYDSYRRVDESFLFTDDISYRGMKPFSTWSGPRYIGGYSDHLAVTVDLIYRN